jgi:hypothetical protein
MNKNGPVLIKNLFANEQNKLDTILRNAANLKRLNSLFQSALNLELAKHCYLVELNGDSISLMVDNASWATALRYAIPDMIKVLKTKPEFKTIQHIHFQLAISKIMDEVKS